MMRCQLFVRWLAKRSCTLVRCRSHAPSSADTTSAATSDTCLMVVAYSSTSSHSEHDLASIVDLSKYPLHDQLAASELIEQAREQFLATGLVTFPGFLQPSAIKQAVEEALPQVSSAFETVQRHNVFLLEQDDDSFGQDHVRNKKLTTQVRSTVVSAGVFSREQCNHVVAFPGSFASPHELDLMTHSGRQRGLRRASSRRNPPTLVRTKLLPGAAHFPSHDIHARTHARARMLIRAGTALLNSSNSLVEWCLAPAAVVVMIAVKAAVVARSQQLRPSCTDWLTRSGPAASTYFGRAASTIGTLTSQSSPQRSVYNPLLPGLAVTFCAYQRANMRACVRACVPACARACVRCVCMCASCAHVECPIGS